jgi:uncharacterized membrane-anchored protein
MNLLGTRVRRVVLVTAIQVALVPIAVAPSLSARLTGDEYLLAVAPLDPIDPFRGAYVALDYPDLPRDSSASGAEPGDTVFIPLEASGELWVGRRAVAERPESGPYLSCKDSDWRLQCGIDSLFLPQDKAIQMEEAVRDGRAVARVRIDSRGNAALVDVEIR